MIKLQELLNILKRKCLTISSFGEAYGSDGGRGRSSHSKSPIHPSVPFYIGNSFNSYEGHSQNRSGFRAEGWSADRGGSNMQLESKFDYTSFPQTLEDLELQYKREAMELSKLRDKEEDDENFKHREAVAEMRDNFMRKVATLKGAHANMWEEFLQFHEQRRQQARQHISESGFASYKQHNYQEFDSSGNLYHSGPSMHSRGRYPNTMDSYPSNRPHDGYEDFQRHRRNDFGKSYNRH